MRATDKVIATLENLKGKFVLTSTIEEYPNRVTSVDVCWVSGWKIETRTKKPWFGKSYEIKELTEIHIQDHAGVLMHLKSVYSRYLDNILQHCVEGRELFKMLKKSLEDNGYQIIKNDK